MASPDLLLGAVWFAVFLLSITVHEASHALVAWKLGDPTAYEGGQVTLDPLPHIRREPFGMVVVPLVSFALSGWMMGWASAPYDPMWARLHPRRSAWMAAAGPASNLLLAIVAGVGIRIGMAGGWLAPPQAVSFAQLVTGTGGAEVVATVLSVMFSLNLLLMAFNLLPLPPLDGGGMLPLILPADAARTVMETLRQPMVSLIGLLIAWQVFGYLFGPIFGLGLRLLYPELRYG